MVKAYFSRLEPFYLMAPNEISDSSGFDAAPVEVNAEVLEKVRKLRSLIVQMEELFVSHPTYEECAQEEADDFVAGLVDIFGLEKDEVTSLQDVLGE